MHQPALYKQGKLSNYQQEKLPQVPNWSWSLYATQWEEQLQNLQRVMAANDNEVPRQIRNNPSLEAQRAANFARHQREKYRDKRLSQEQEEALTNIPGWSWIDPCHDAKATPETPRALKKPATALTASRKRPATALPSLSYSAYLPPKIFHLHWVSDTMEIVSDIFSNRPMRV